MRGELTQDSTHQRQNSLHFLFFFAPFQGHLELTPLWFIPFRPNHAPGWVFLYLTLSCCPAHMSCRALPLVFNQCQGQPHHLYLKLKLGGKKALDDGANILTMLKNCLCEVRGMQNCGNGILLVSSVGMCMARVCAAVALNWLGKGQGSSGNPAGIFARSTPQQRCFCLPAVLRAVRTVLAYSDHGIADTPAHPLHTHLSRYTHPLLSARVKNQTGSWPLRWEHFDTEIK